MKNDDQKKEVNLVCEPGIGFSQRDKNIKNARQIAIFAVRDITNMSMNLIGEEFGGRDHSTIVYALKQIEKNMEKDPKLKATVNDIIKNIKNR